MVVEEWPKELLATHPDILSADEKGWAPCSE
jgi:hypothetical protein